MKKEMGQNNSLPTNFQQFKKTSKGSLRRSFSCKSTRSRSHQGSLSATFNFNNTNITGNHLNINTASEEELMTLPGISRTLAKNIVEHREVIGRFKKIEDLALVSGVGADRLNLIRPEICVHHKITSSSFSSSNAPSVDSLISNNDSSRTLTIDINSGNVFSFMSLNGINQELAANIVDYRERRGYFNNFDDLLKVRGMNIRLLEAIRPHLIIGPPHSPTTSSKQISNRSVFSKKFALTTSRFSGERKMQSNGYTPINDIFELLSSFSQRPIVEEVFDNAADGHQVLRLASWNLHSMNEEKSDNPGVREVICRTLLENRFSLVAVQEVESIAALEKLILELNYPKLRKVVEWRGKCHHWKYGTLASLSDSQKIGCAFIYDSQSGLNIEDIKMLPHEDNLVSSLAKFTIGASTVTILNIHYTKEGKIQEYIKLIQNMKPDIILGDFTKLQDTELELEDFTRIFSKPTFTNSINSNVVQFRDNIFLNKCVLSKYSGISGVVRQGLEHLAIPRGWSWGGPASEHCPIWCELYV
uniref:Endonuclease/exonuclease/phosphatase family domain-containing protein 1 n=3 Tax=Clastoptera arizonana TaxID=38151 RepID=A0A1B6CQC6_9HEMI